jgi:hypothetical protein
MLSGDLAMEQAPIFDCPSFDPFTLFDDGLCTSEVDVGGCDVADALVITAMIVMLDEGLDLTLEIAGQELVLEQDAVLEGLMPSLDLTLGLRMQRCAADMAHAVGIDPFGKLGGDVTGTIVAEQSGLVHHLGVVAA